MQNLIVLQLGPRTARSSIGSPGVGDALVGEPANPTLLALVADEELHAPALLDFEVASALRGHVLAGKLTTNRMSEAVEDFRGLQIVRYHGGTLLGDVLELRDNFTVYDAAYIVLARALERRW